MGKQVNEGIEISQASLTRVLACCLTILSIKDQRWKSWIFEISEYAHACRVLALDTLLTLFQELEGYSGFEAKKRKVVAETKDIRPMISLLASIDAPIPVWSDLAQTFQRLLNELDHDIEQNKETSLEINPSALDDVIQKLYWMLSPEVIFSRYEGEMALSVVHRNRLRARDMLVKLSELLPDDHPLQDYCTSGVLEAYVLDHAADLRRDWPGMESEQKI